MHTLQSFDLDDRSPRRASTHAGDLVTIRSQRWLVLEVQTFEHCQVVAVRGTGAVNAGVTQRFLLPFESVAALNRPTSIRFVRPRLWRRACRALLAADTPPGGLRAAPRARIDLLPHQLEPALAIVRGLGARVLLADDVGLGKTIQAGLIVTELQARGMAERVLILTPAGLREQWAAELWRRFATTASVVDFHDVRHRLANLPLGLNPWSTVPVAIASIDYVKRPEILHSVFSCRWDILVVDEAHGTAGDSDRHAAVTALAARIPYVLLLTATPHNGDQRAFHSLCRTGAHDDTLLVFRRTRADVRFDARRRVHRLQVRPSAAESLMHRRLAEFTQAVRLEHEFDAVWLTLSVLHKRALSSARSLQQSIGRRLAALEPAGDDSSCQLSLPLADPGGEFDRDDAPPDWFGISALSDGAREGRMLRSLSEAAKAATTETKVGAIRRLLRRISEPLIIFTEYRDTLLHVRDQLSEPASILHGALTRTERAAELDSFLNGRRRILLATDAAGEGLNLHQRCRIVVNLELPWNPMRLEQRIGRVDRIGQERTVHAFHLIARGTGETQVLSRLKLRIAQARLDIAAADPMAFDEREIARALFGQPDPPLVTPEQQADHSEDALQSERLIVSLRADALDEVKRLLSQRDLSSEGDHWVQAALEATGTWITRAKLRRTRLGLGPRILAMYRVDDENDDARTTDSTLIPVGLVLGNRNRYVGRSGIRAILRGMGPKLRTQAEQAAAHQRTEFERFSRARLNTRRARETQIAEALDHDRRAPLQAGLFDRRSEHQSQSAQAASDEIARESAAQLARWSRTEIVGAPQAKLLLVLVP
jgi:superfamily II DNA or RNA helicase